LITIILNIFLIAELFGDERGDLDEGDEAGEELFGDDMER
jgi:hypothetical protein